MRLYYLQHSPELCDSEETTLTELPEGREFISQLGPHRRGESFVLLEHALQDTGNTELMGWALVRFKVRGGFHSKPSRPKADPSLPTPDCGSWNPPPCGNDGQEPANSSIFTAAEQECGAGQSQVQARQEVSTVSCSPWGVS